MAQAHWNLDEVWNSPDQIMKVTLSQWKCRHWNYIQENQLHKADTGVLIKRLWDFKSNQDFELFLDRIETLQARSIFLKFRCGILPVNKYRRRWREYQGPFSCPLCEASTELEEHFMFFCPSCTKLRKAWITRICRTRSIANPKDAIRILKIDNTEWLVFALSPYFMQGDWDVKF